jgi:hypothetical protein
MSSAMPRKYVLVYMPERVSGNPICTMVATDKYLYVISNRTEGAYVYVSPFSPIPDTDVF